MGSGQAPSAVVMAVRVDADTVWERVIGSKRVSGHGEPGERGPSGGTAGRSGPSSAPLVIGSGE